MDWKYKHLHQERVFPEPRDLVLKAACTFMAESLEWQIADAPDGFAAEGNSFAHRAVADFRLQSVAGGTKLVVDLRVEGASALGFMLFDVGGYYSIQIPKGLGGPARRIPQNVTGR